MQCALFISGLWGVFVFKEVQGMKAIAAFFLAGTVLLSGAAVLGVFGPQKPAAAVSNGTNTSNTSYFNVGITDFGPLQ
jgi:hypothetical protein